MPRWSASASNLEAEVEARAQIAEQHPLELGIERERRATKNERANRCVPPRAA
jgi:hypothetical protein